MARVAGIDPGTFSFDLVILDGGEPVAAHSFPTAELSRDPGPLIEALSAHGPLELITGPSGYGAPLRRMDQLTQRERALLTLVRPDERGKQVGIGGLGRILTSLAQLPWPTCLLPGVRHLATVPAHRKVNRIDMGTADKLCAAALALWHHHRQCGLPLAECDFLLVEVGGAFTALLGVAGGSIVDGVGGTSGPPGFLAGGAMDGEVAYWLGRVGKQTLFSGGISAMAGQSAPDVAAFLAGVAAGDTRCCLAWEAFLEGVQKAVAQLRVSVPFPQALYLSGRLTQYEPIRAALVQRLSGPAPVELLPPPAGGAKTAALGAAMLADGLVGGPHAPLVAALRLSECGGEVVDQIYFQGAPL